MMSHFQNAYVINLPFKQDRLAKFLSSVPPSFGNVTVWPAVHGDSVQHPDWWTAGRGAWGCYRSHMQILEHCYQNNVESYVVFEDDAIFRSNAESLLDEFLAELPGDWEQIYLGGQLLHEIDHPPKCIANNVYIPYNVNRTHCFAVHRRGYQKLYKHLNASPFQQGEHIDHHVGRLHESGQLKIYCLGKWIVGQDGGPSNISGRTNSPTFWVDPEKLSRSNWRTEPMTCVFLESSIEVAVELQNRGWHRGHWQNAERLDRGICDAVVSNNVLDQLMKWYRVVAPEAVREGHKCVCLYHPALNWESIKDLPIPQFVRVTVDAKLWKAEDIDTWDTRVRNAADEAEKILAGHQVQKTFVGNPGLKPTKHLIYHIWPKAGNGIWQWNVKQLLERIDLFDGVRTIGIVTDSVSDQPSCVAAGVHTVDPKDETAWEGEAPAEPISANDIHPQFTAQQGVRPPTCEAHSITDTIEAVQAAFAGVRIDNWITFPNDPNLGEVVTFEKMLESLPRDDNSVTFYGHAKGVRHGGDYNTKRWAEAMYEVCLDDEEFIVAALRSHPITGPFKRGGEPNQGPWHYSGTFFWFRNGEVFARNWRQIDRNYMGVEFWPRLMFTSDQAGSLFGHGAGFLYNGEEWESHIQPWLEDFRRRVSNR